MERTRREFLSWAARRGAGLGLATVSMPALLAACGEDEPAIDTGARKDKDAARAIVGDVVDFELTSEDWEGAFGFATFRLHRAKVSGKDVYFIRTDTSDEGYARREKLVYAPKIGGLAPAGLAGSAYFVKDGETVLSTEPGRDDYTPAWRVHQATWKRTAKPLASVEAVRAAQAAGDLTVEDTNVVLNAAVVKWSTGEMPVDGELTKYLGQGQLVEAPDTSAMTVKLKLHECFPGVRYIVLDHSIKPAAEMTKTVYSPRLHKEPRAKGATGRTNVFMNGVTGPGPMGFQPSVFDSQAGSAEWSPYWDHMTYAWKDGKTPRVLRTEKEIHAARDAGDLDEFPGVPDTKGEVFTVNCPVPVLAPNAFKG